MDEYKAALRNALERTRRWKLDTQSCVLLDAYLRASLLEAARDADA